MFLLSPCMIMRMIRFVVTSLTKALLHQVLSLASSRKSPGCFKLLPLMLTETGNLQCCINWSVPFPRSVPRYNMSRRSIDNSLDFMAWFVLWCAVSPVGSYIDRCLPFQIMSNQLCLPQSSCRNISRMISTWAQFRVSWLRLWILMYMWFILIFS